MGYCAKQVAGEFFMSGEHRRAAYDDLAQAILDCRGVDTLKNQFETFCWSIRSVGEGGDITRLWFVGEKWRDQDEPLKVIAPFVKHGSFVEMLGEDGERWRLTFWNGTLVEQKCRLVWDALPEPITPTGKTGEEG